MSEYNWCHGTKCHTYKTQDRVRGVKGNKVLRTRKIKITQWNFDSPWRYFCSQGCWTDFFISHANQCINIAPRNEALETPVNVSKEERTSTWSDRTYTETVITPIQQV